MMPCAGYNNANATWVIALPEEPNFLKRLVSSFWPWGSSRRKGPHLSGPKARTPYSTDEEKLLAETVPPDEVGCPEVRELTSDYLEESLSGGWVDAIKRHLSDCEACTAFINTFRATVDMLREIPRAHAPESVRHSIIAAISKHRS